MPRNRSEKRTSEDEYFLKYMQAWVAEMWREDGNHVRTFPRESRAFQLLHRAPRGMNHRIRCLAPEDRKAWVDAKK